MSTSTISALPAATALAGTEVIETVQAGTSVKTTASAIAALSSASPGGSSTQLQYNNATAFGGTAGATWDATTGSITITGGENSGATPVLNLGQIWNSGGSTFTGYKLNITDTASTAGSLLADYQVGGTSKWKVTKGGATTQTGVAAFPQGSSSAPSLTYSASVATGIYFPAGGYVTVTHNGTIVFGLDAGNSLTVYNGKALRFDAGEGAGDVSVSRIASTKLEINNGTNGTVRDLALRQLYPDFTNTATVGAVTINKSAGQAIVAASASSVVVTNSLVTANSQVFCTIAANDATATIKNCVAGPGSFTLTLTAAATANCPVNFLVLNQ